MKKPKNRQGRKASKQARFDRLVAASRGSTYGQFEEIQNKALVTGVDLSDGVEYCAECLVLPNGHTQVIRFYKVIEGVVDKQKAPHRL